MYWMLVASVVIIPPSLIHVLMKAFPIYEFDLNEVEMNSQIKSIILLNQNHVERLIFRLVRHTHVLGLCIFNQNECVKGK